MLDINPGLILWTIITFVILLFILTKTAWKPLVEALEGLEGLEAAHPGHHDVAEDDVEVLLRGPLQGLEAVLDAGHAVPQAAQGEGQHVPQALLIVDDQDAQSLRSVVPIHREAHAELRSRALAPRAGPASQRPSAAARSPRRTGLGT